jgi:hypothetical protein
LYGNQITNINLKIKIMTTLNDTRKDYSTLTKEELVKEANALRIYLERFVDNCKSNDQQRQLTRIVLESDLSIKKFN